MKCVELRGKVCFLSSMHCGKRFLTRVFIFQRVKVYHLNEDGKWDDRGTGHVSIDYVEVCFDSN